MNPGIFAFILPPSSFREMQHYSSIDYYTPGWTYARSRLREPFPRRRRGWVAAILPLPLPPPSEGTPERTFVAGPRGETFVPINRGAVFSAPPRGVVFVSGQ